MAKAKKNEAVDKTDDEKTLLEIENINPKKTKSKKIKEVVVAKEDKVEPKKEDKKSKPKDKSNEMTDKELKKELLNKNKEIEKVKKLVAKMNEIIE
jgi:hypothetical protein